MSEDFGLGAVVMAVYRPDEKLFARQIVSLRAQTVTGWRCLVGIDGADPETAELARRLVDGDLRFEVVEYPDNVGVYRHFERLLAWVPEDVAWVSLADQDDYWYPDKFERMLPLLSDPTTSAVIAQARLVNEDGECLGGTDRKAGSLAQILLRNQVSGAMAIFRRWTVADCQPFPAATNTAMHDHWLGVWAAAHGRVDLLDEPVQDYVQHGRNVLGEPRQPSLRESWQNVISSGGLLAHVRAVTRHRWGWRVSMARRVLPTASGADASVMRDLARGSISFRILGLIRESLRSHMITARDAVGLLAAPLLWPLLGRRWIETLAHETQSRAPVDLMHKAVIVVPLFDPDDDVVENVRAMAQQAHVVCVDDGSPGSAADVLDRTASLPGVTLSTHAANLGIAAALNTGAKLALRDGADVVVTLDQDSRPGGSHVERMLEELNSAEAGDIGVVGPGFIAGRPIHGDVLLGTDTVTVPELMQTGLAVPRRTFDQVGYFDERFFIDAVDTEFCLRVRRVGLRVVAVPDMDIEHRLGAGGDNHRWVTVGRRRFAATFHSPERRYYINRNLIHVLRLHGRRELRWAWTAVRRAVMADILAVTVEDRRREKAWAIVQGLTHGFAQVAGRRGSRSS
jgi:GT2 family glycosyltransferase